MRQWIIKNQPEYKVDELCAALHCSHYFARILINRGFDTVDRARNFLKVDRRCLNDPFLFRDMRKAVERIVVALRAKEKITVYGDYDVDGITATGLLVEFLRELDADVDYYIPSRFTEGYGVNTPALQKIAENGTQLVITVDTGITAVAEVEEAKRLGLDVIITDHHECQQRLPDTLIINPKQPDSGYPFENLAGVGVVFKLICAINSTYGNYDIDRYLPFTAIGTIADIMPMCGENRYIIRRGLELLRTTDCCGLRAMIDQCVGNRPIDTSTIGFVIAPRINAAGRMGSASLGVELLTTDDPQKAVDLVDELCKENNHRQKIENGILEEAVAMIENDPENAKRNAIVLWSENWHNGVVGIVASRLKERYGKPCILFSVTDGRAKGSGRSVRPFNLFEALENCGGLIEKFGGHAFAAGVLVTVEKLKAFRDAFCAEVDRFLSANEFDESIEVDCLLGSGDLALDCVKELERLAPFGRDNETPLFAMRNVQIAEAVPTANGNHMRLSLYCGNQRVTAFFFNVAPARFPYRSGECVDAVFEVDINVYNGRKSVQLSLKDMHYAYPKFDTAQQELWRIQNLDAVKTDVPERHHTAAVYRCLRRQLSSGCRSFDLSALADRIENEQGYKLTLGMLYYSLEILKELGVLEYQRNGLLFDMLEIHPEKQVDLRNSEILREIIEKAGETVCV